MLKTNIKGFTLVESIIAITIVVLAAAAILPLVLYSSQTTYSNQNLITANNLASSVMEEIRSFDFESIGTVGGNPEGTIEQEQTRTLNGYDYDIYTTISWASAQHKDEINQVAYKNIRIIVKGKNVHSNAEGVTLAELHSIAARDGEEPLIEEGHLKVSILDANNSPVYEGISVRIERAGRPTQTQNIDYSGQALFSMLDQGNYSVTVTIPNDMFGIGGDVYDPESNTIVKENVYVANYATTEIIFLVDYKDNAGGLELQFIDKAKNTPIVRAGAITIELNFGGTNYSINKRFEVQDFIDNTLPKEILGFLPVGAEITDINVTDILGYNNYKIDPDYGEALKTADGTTWSRIISKPHEKVLIPLVSINSSYFYEENTKEDFEKYPSSGLFVHDEGKLTLETGSTPIEIDNADDQIETNADHPGQSGKQQVGSAFDGDLDTHWHVHEKGSGNNNPIILEIDLNETRTLKEIIFYFEHLHKDYVIEDDDFNIYIKKNKDEYKDIQIEKIIEEEWNNNNHSRKVIIELKPTIGGNLKISFTNKSNGVLKIAEIKLIAYDYAPNGYRIVGPLDLKGYEPGTKFSVFWEAKIPEGTSLEIGALILDEGVEPEKSDFTKGTIISNSGDTIPNISWGESFEGRSLWLIERFTSNEDNGDSPELTRLYIDTE